MTLQTVTPPWQAPLTLDERTLVYYFLVIAGLALFAMLLRSLATLRDIGSRYRGAVLAGVGVVAVAFLSYVVLAVKFDVGYDERGGMFVPNGNAIWSWAPRFMDWSVTVPLLMVELIGVSALAGLLARRMRVVGVAAAFLMIFTGYLGGVVIDGGASLAALWTWGIISSIFFVVLYAVVLVTVLRSLPALPAPARPLYRAAMVLLLVVWFAYPIVFGFQGFTSGGGWTTAEQLVLSSADIVAKVGFGLLIHHVAKLRTAADVAAGLEVQPGTLATDRSGRSAAEARVGAGTAAGTEPRAGSPVE